MQYASRYLRIMDPLMEGIDVRNVQEQLQELGYYEGDITGIYDRDTAEAVRNFQEAFGLTADGIVGPDTWNAIGLSEESLQYFDTQYNITVDMEQFELTLKEGQEIIEVYPVAVGKPATPTPTGNWRIIQKTENPGGPFGARWMRLNVPWGGYGIHGTDDPESIGQPVSHGCIRMNNDDVIELYDIVPLGTEVKIIGETFTGRVLYLGVDGGADVVRVQEILQNLGYYTGPLDGEYDEEVRDAILDFQRDYGLMTDGVVGPNTYEALEKMNDTLLGSDEP
jgi:L,D-transpeptidase ErfK/SrfK